MHYTAATSAEPRETLHDLLGAGGPSIHWPRAGLFFAALFSSALLTFVAQAILGGFTPPLRFVGIYFISNLVLTAAALVALRWFRNPMRAALLAPAFYLAAMLPVRAWQLYTTPEESRLRFATFLLVFSLVGNFLLFAALHLFLRWIRPLFPALALGVAVSNLLGDVAQLPLDLAFGFFLSVEGILTNLAFGLGGAAVFAAVYWGGTLLPFMRLPGRVAAAAAPAVGGAMGDLQRAADFRSVRKRLKPAAIGSIIFGLIAIGLGIASLEDSPLNAFLVLLGFFLLGEGIWLLIQPTPVGMIVDGVALCLIGLWNLLVTFANVQSGGGFRGFAVLGIFQIIMGVQSFRRYGRFAHLGSGTASSEAIQRVDALVAGIADASMKTSADIIEFTAGGQQWKGRLAPDLAVFVAGAEEEVVLAGKGEVTITPQEPVAGKAFAAAFQLGPHGHKGSLSPEAFQRYETWRSSR